MRRRRITLDDQELERVLIRIAQKYGVEMRCGVSTDALAEGNKRTLFINRFVAIRTGARRGSGAMKAVIRICRMARLASISLIAYPLVEMSGSEDEEARVRDLVTWYERLGYKLTEDLNPHAGNEMKLTL